LLHLKQWYSRGNQARAKGVTQIMITKRRPQDCFLDSLLEPEPAIERRLIPFRCDEGLAFRCALSQAHQTPARGAADLHRAWSRFSRDVENSLLNLPVLPLTVELFAAAHAGTNRELDLKRFLWAISANRREQPSLLVPAEIANVNRRFFGPGDASASQGIYIGESLTHCVSEYGRQQRVKAIDRRALDLRMRLISACEILKEAFNSSRRKLADTQFPDSRQDTPQPHPIGVNRRGLIPPEALCFDCRLYEIPELQLVLNNSRSARFSRLGGVRRVFAGFHEPLVLAADFCLPP
jgi:hypothetical protein